MKSERGAMLIMVALALVALTALSAIVLDYGIVWTARGQAQNAADAGALSAGWWLMDNPTDFDGSKVAARKMANGNAIWGENPLTPDILVTSPITCPPGTGGGTCAKVDVQRGARDANGTDHTNVLPTFFASMLGVNSQSIMATATVQLAQANATGCMRPWFMVDQYTDNSVPPNDTFDPGDVYTNPGYQIPRDIGTIVHFHENGSPSGYGQIDVGSGGQDIRDAIKHCVGDGFHYHIGQVVDTEPGGKVGPESQGIDVLTQDWDPNARFDLSTDTVINSCADTTAGCLCPDNGSIACPNGRFVSPRIVVVALCAPTEPSCAGGGTSNSTITVTNFLSFFILGHSGNGHDLVIDAQLIGSAGEIDTSGGTSPSAFLQVVRLVR